MTDSETVAPRKRGPKPKAKVDTVATADTAETVEVTSYNELKESVGAVTPEPKTTAYNPDYAAIAASVGADFQKSATSVKFYKGNYAVSLGRENYKSDAELMTALRKSGF